MPSKTNEKFLALINSHFILVEVTSANVGCSAILPERVEMLETNVDKYVNDVSSNRLKGIGD